MLLTAEPMVLAFSATAPIFSAAVELEAELITWEAALSARPVSLSTTVSELVLFTRLLEPNTRPLAKESL